MSLAGGDLTTLATAKAYIPSPPADAVLQGLISRISRSVLGILNRDLLVPHNYTRQFSGSGTNALIIPDWPLLTVTSLNVNGIIVPVSPPPASINPITVTFGYRFPTWDGLPPGQPAALQLAGLGYTQGVQNVIASYTAGYQVSSEAQVVPATPFQVTPQAPYGSWATDQGVMYANGTPLVAIPSGTPTVGQYVPPSPGAASPILYYQFAAADTGANVLLNYGFIPGDVEQTVLEIIAERASYRNRVGVHSQMLASQETLTFNSDGLNRFVVDSLLNYISVLPPPMGILV